MDLQALLETLCTYERTFFLMEGLILYTNILAKPLFHIHSPLLVLSHLQEDFQIKAGVQDFAGKTTQAK